MGAPPTPILTHSYPFLPILIPMLILDLIILIIRYLLFDVSLMSVLILISLFVNECFTFFSFSCCLNKFFVFVNDEHQLRRTASVYDVPICI